MALGAALTWLGGCSKCSKDEPPPPLPAPATPEASSPTVLVVDAGDDGDAGDADAEAGPKPRGRAPTSSMKACCDALSQNAANAPEPTATYMKTAAAACYAAVQQGKDKSSIIAIVQGALRGAGLPAACK